ncbi:MAG: Fe-S protein assembly chaperone HscA [Phycisphaeraceae bacterium]|nr:Fe-S protein assembly chaperone HscA [Phycisphaeraceae bacterium]
MAVEPECIVGIDLGTTHSLIAFADASGPRVLPDSSGRPLCPSVVLYLPDGHGGVHPIVGWDALAKSQGMTRSTIASVKRLMGRSRSDVEGDLAYLGYRVVEGDHATARVAVPTGTGFPDRVISPQEVSAAILSHLKRQAEAALGRPIQKAVITVPAYFDDAQRQATREAGRFAGLDVVRIVNEPTAAALAYGLGSGHTTADSRERVIAVYDLGGGTFDISILKISPPAAPGETAFFQVLATAGDTHLGGDDFDRVLAEALFADVYGDESSGTPSNDARMRLMQVARELKHRLSDEPEAEVEVPGSDGRPVQFRITRERFEALVLPLVERTLSACRRAVTDAAAKTGGKALDAVIMVGGATRVPLVRSRVGAFFGIEPYTGVDPDQVVALGAAVQGDLLARKTGEALLLDVIPLSLGIETVGGAVAKLIMRNSTVPAKATEMFSTSVDGQTAIKLHVVQGEREMVADCRSLGMFLLAIPPMPAGIPQVEVSFLIDANGVLRVSAIERRSGRRASIQVVPNHGLTKDEVDRIERDSLVHAREDMTQHRVIDLVASARLDLKWIQDRLGRFGARLDAPAREHLESHVAAVGAMVAAAEADWRAVDPDTFQRAKEALDRASIRLQELAILDSLQAQSPD